MGDSAKKTEGKMRSFAIGGSVALGSLAAGGTRDIASVIRSLAGLGFAMGPLTGVIGLAAASIGIAFAESRKQSGEEMRKMIADLHQMERQFSESAKRIRITVLEGQRDALLGAVDRMPGQVSGDIREGSAGWGDLFGNIRNMFSGTASDDVLARVDELSSRIQALRNSLAKEGRDSVAKAAEDFGNTMHAAIRKSRDELDAWAVTHYNQVPGVNDLLSDYAKWLAKADDEAKTLANTIQTNLTKGVNDAFGRKMQDELDEIIRKLRLYTDALNEAQRAKEREAEMLKGTFYGTVSGILGQVGGPIGGAATAALDAYSLGAGPMGITLAAVNSLIGGIFGLGDAAERQAEVLRQLRVTYDSFTDSVRLGLGLISDTEYALREMERRFAEARRQWEEIIADTERVVIGEPSDPLYLEAKRRLEELAQLQELERARILQLEKEMELLNGIKNAPSGFFVERYLGAFPREVPDVGDLPGSGRNPGGRRGPPIGGAGNITFDLSNATFTLQGANGEQVFKDFVSVLRQKAASTVGNGGKLSAALDVM